MKEKELIIGAITLTVIIAIISIAVVYIFDIIFSS